MFVIIYWLTFPSFVIFRIQQIQLSMKALVRPLTYHSLDQIGIISFVNCCAAAVARAQTAETQLIVS